MPPSVLASYKAGITAMLNLPPTDPRNWYRNAIVHAMDCPHRNWWFLVWHRAYIGWLEATIRQLSGDSEFALPYWDWTRTKRVPPAMFDGVLDPNNDAFIPTFEDFSSQFGSAITSLYAAFSPQQRTVLGRRQLTNPITTATGFWSYASQVFFDQPNARGLTATNPSLDSTTQAAVSTATIRSALRTSTFAGSGGPGSPVGFHSAKAADHSIQAAEGILESQPHDNVHGAMGGGGDAFMVDMLSPVDPIFFLHHANLDRLWDVWTRRQTALGRPTLPSGADLSAWSGEQFLFFSDANGQPVSQIEAGDYKSMSVFDYDYSPGSGEDQVPATGTVVAAPEPQAFAGHVTAATIARGPAAGGAVSVPAAAFHDAAAGARSPTAEITLDLGHADQGRRFRVLVSAGGRGAPRAAGAITVFGHAHGPTTFSVPLPADLGSAAAAAGGNVPLDIRVVPIGTPPRGAAAFHEAIAPPPRVSAIQVTTD